MNKTFHFDDIFYSAIIEPTEYDMNFKVYKTIGLAMSGGRYWRTPSDKETSNIEEAEVFMSGHIKWDGCMNLQFDSQTTCMLHFCGRSMVKQLDTLFSKLYDLAEKEIKHADRKLME